MNVSELMSIEKLERYIDEGFVSKRKHPVFPIYILNYGQKTQYNWLWDEVTLNTRGLVVDENYEIIARSLPKFFSYQQLNEQLPEGSFVVEEKLDGCFTRNTPVNCWDGTTVTIGNIVKHSLNPTLVGKDINGNLVPSYITNRFKNGIKSRWVDLTLDCPSTLGTGSGSKFPNKLKLTPNHRVCINDKFQPAINAKVGDEVISYKIKIPNRIEHLIQSGLLGDGSLCYSHNKLKYSESHKEGHEAYVDKILYWLGSYGIKKDTRISGYGSVMKRAVSKSLDLKYIHDEWYKNGKKSCATKFKLG